MRCPKCASDDTKVVDTRIGQRTRRRRRECKDCGERFSTTEVHGIQSANSVLPLFPIEIVKRDGKTEKFDEPKLRRSIEHACSRRGVTTEMVEDLIVELCDRISSEREPVSVERIVDLACSELARVDKVAVRRYAHQYNEFADSKQVDRYIAKLGK